MKRSEMTATTLRTVLAITLAALAMLGVGVFYGGYHILLKTAAETSAIASQAAESSNKVKQLKEKEAALDKHHSTVEKASKIVASSQSYVYQDQIISDLNRIAGASGITVLDITFNDPTTSAASPATPAPTAVASQQSTIPSTPSQSSQAMSIKTITASVRLSDKIEYDKMVNFLYAIEQNLTRMSIAKVSLKNAPGGLNGKPAVTTDQLNIEVYIR